MTVMKLPCGFVWRREQRVRLPLRVTVRGGEAKEMQVNGRVLLPLDDDGAFLLDRTVLRDGINYILLDGIECEALRVQGDVACPAGFSPRDLLSLAVLIDRQEKRIAVLEEALQKTKKDWLI
ncbi:MAG: hypothetical protein E7663_03195 [Ruminococcaceae bacterium]|nr:hypothetical protein [Oscillospiraceae bacterium]